MCSLVDELRFCIRPKRGPNHMPAPPPGPPRLIVSCDEPSPSFEYILDPAREIRGKPKYGRTNSFPVYSPPIPIHFILRKKNK